MSEILTGYCDKHGRGPHVLARYGDLRCLRCIKERRAAPRWLAIRTTLGKTLQVAKDGSDVVFRANTFVLSRMPLHALQEAKEGGLHLTQDEDPAYWLNPKIVQFILAVLPS